VAILDQTATLERIREKVVAGERLNLEDGLLLMESDHVLSSASWPTSRGANAAATTRSTSSRTCT
jgi:hypothetical protein